MTSADCPCGNSRRRSAHPSPEKLDVDMCFDIDGLYALRSTLAAHASGLGAPEEQIERLVIVASELATNAIRHGGGSGQLLMWHRDGTIYCQVSDGGPGVADPMIGTKAPDPADSDAHRGLWICHNLTEELTIEANPDGPGATVTATIARVESP